MEKSFAEVRKELDELGYTEIFKPECLPLVKRLLGDLKITTDSLRKYMKISQQALEERDSLKLGAEPYKCDNAKLIKECNELHLAFIKFKEQHEKVQRDLRSKISSLENQLTDCSIEKQKLKLRVQELEQGVKGPVKKVQSKNNLSKAKIDTNRKSQVIMATTDHRLNKLNGDLKNLKDEQIQLLKNNEFLMLQLENRDQEIKRLASLLEGGRPTKAVIKDCCYKNVDNKIGSLEDEITTLKHEKNSLQLQLKEALSKQHEAMRRALNLAERNKSLEAEMKDIDKIALSVEAECNNTVKSNVEKVSKLQDQINDSLIKIQNLEMDLHRTNMEKTELAAELDAIKLEKKRLKSMLADETEERKRLTDRLKNFGVIEHSLNLEIDRLLRLSGDQKRKIAELESDVTARKIRMTSIDDDTMRALENVNKPRGSAQHKKGCRKAAKDDLDLKLQSFRDKSPPTKDSNRLKSAPLKGPYDPNMKAKCCCEAGRCIKWMKELLDKEIENRQDQANRQIEALRNEKEFYMKEYHRLLERPKSTSSSEKSSKKLDDLLNRIKEKDQIISTLQEDLKTLTNEKYALTSRLESQNRENSISEFDEGCTRATCKRKARELDVHKEEVKHLEKENDGLKTKIQSLSETSVFNEERMKKAFQEMEEHINKLENERRDLVISQGTNRSNISQLEDECRTLKDKLQTAQKEANNQRANYEQLKVLHDQTSRALSDAQSQLMRAESEAQNLQSKIGQTSREANCYEREISRLQGDIDVMKSQLTKIDKEKDELLNIVDEKTEKVDRLENELREKRNLIINLEKEVKDLSRKIRSITDEHSSNESQLRSYKQEINMLQDDLEAERRAKDIAQQENRRLQEDMASIVLDCKDARKELDITKRQVEDLKRQLQHYVAEIKRFEDLMSQKELERTEILDQFRSLSHENNVLETTNHTLESEASQTKVQLSLALDHASDMERKVETLESVIRSYENQIAELTSQVASMEIQMKQSTSIKDQTSEDLKRLKDLCMKLDKEKDELRQEIRNKEDQKLAVDRKLDLLTIEYKDLKRALDKDKNAQDGLETLLNEARRDLAQQRLLNEELQSEINNLRRNINELQEKLSVSSEQLDMYQEKAFEYSQQNKQLRREIANERFRRTRDDDEKRSPHLEDQRTDFEFIEKIPINIEEKVDIRDSNKSSFLPPILEERFTKKKQNEDTTVFNKNIISIDEIKAKIKTNYKEFTDDDSSILPLLKNNEDKCGIFDEEDCTRPLTPNEDDQMIEDCVTEAISTEKEIPEIEEHYYCDDFEAEALSDNESETKFCSLDQKAINPIVNSCTSSEATLKEDTGRKTYTVFSDKSDCDIKIKDEEEKIEIIAEEAPKESKFTPKNNKSTKKPEKTVLDRRNDYSKTKVGAKVENKDDSKSQEKSRISNCSVKNKEKTDKTKREDKNTKIPTIKNRIPPSKATSTKTKVPDETGDTEEFDLNKLKSQLPPISLRRPPNANTQKNLPKPKAVTSEKKLDTKLQDRIKPIRPIKKTTTRPQNKPLGPINVYPVDSNHPEFKIESEPNLTSVKTNKPAVSKEVKVKPKFFTFSPDDKVVPISKKVKKEIV